MNDLELVRIVVGFMSIALVFMMLMSAIAVIVVMKYQDCTYWESIRWWWNVFKGDDD